MGGVNGRDATPFVSTAPAPAPTPASTPAPAFAPPSGMGCVRPVCSTSWRLARRLARAIVIGDHARTPKTKQTTLFTSFQSFSFISR